MLREIANTRQIEGEPPRKWFFSDQLDLVVWFNSAGLPCAFQLAYDKYKNEHSISWHHERGYRHYLVDDQRNATPFLYTNGPFRQNSVIDQFLALSKELPATVTEFVTKKLQYFSGETKA